jgi:5-methylcytosine-specific restriction protein A
MLKPAILHKLRPGRAKLNLPTKRAASFYLSPEWKQLIASIKQKRGHYCQHPQHPSGVPRWKGRMYGDHIIELKDGGATLDPRNIMLLCHSCHQRKTAEQRGQRYHGHRGV